MFEGAAAALGTDVSPGGKDTHVSLHLRAVDTPWSSFLTASILPERVVRAVRKGSALCPGSYPVS